MTPKPRVLWLVYRESLAGIISSTVAVPASRLIEAGLDVSIVFMSPLGEFVRASQRRKWNKVAQSLNTLFRGLIKRLPSPPSRAQWLWDDAAALAMWMRRHYGKEEIFIVHCRGARATDVALRMRDSFPLMRVICDLRGLVAYDAVSPIGDLSDAAEPSQSMLQLEARATKGSDAVVCLSEKMRKYVRNEISVAPDKPVLVVPCCVDLKSFGHDTAVRKQMRASLGLTDKTVVLYSGGVRRWHWVSRSIQVFKAIRQKDSSAHLLALTNSVARLKELLRDAGIPETATTVQTAEYAAMADLLSCGDIGLSLITPGRRTEVCSPVKVGEYLASLVPAVVNEGVGDIADLVAEERIGAVIPNDADDRQISEIAGELLNELRDNGDALRGRCREAAACELSWDAKLDVLLGLYGELLGKSAGK